jgi:hypothetical protein
MCQRRFSDVPAPVLKCASAGSPMCQPWCSDMASLELSCPRTGDQLYRHWCSVVPALVTSCTSTGAQLYRRWYSQDNGCRVGNKKTLASIFVTHTKKTHDFPIYTCSTLLIMVTIPDICKKYDIHMTFVKKVTRCSNQYKIYHTLYISTFCINTRWPRDIIVALQIM